MRVLTPYREPERDISVKYVLEVIEMAGEAKESRGKGISGLVFVGCLMIGLATGFITGEIVAGVLGGLGVGFIGMAIMRYKTGEW